MGWANKILGWTSGNGAEVDADNNLYITGQQVNQRYGGVTPKPNSVGAVRLFCENDPGMMTGVPVLRSPWVTQDDRLSVGVDTPLLNHQFTSTAVNTSRHNTLTATATATYSGGFLVLAGGTAATHGACISTRRMITLMGNGSLRNHRRTRRQSGV
jgi:hypothetical protein